ncbi:MAG: hypothetical protein ACFFCI_20930, partial [Promethearchaeota archaeon]
SYTEVKEQLQSKNLQKKGMDILYALANGYGCTVDELYSEFIEHRNFVNTIDKLRNPDPDEPPSFNSLRNLYLHARKDIANKDVQQALFNAMRAYHPLFSILKSSRASDFYKFLTYFDTAEQYFREHFLTKLGEYQELTDQDKISAWNQYCQKSIANFNDPNIRELQTALLLLVWDGRDALTGRKFEAGTEVIRHHYRILFIGDGGIEYIKFDCRLQALVPLTRSSHAKMQSLTNAKEYESNFMTAMEKWLNGEWYVPTWWKDPNDIKAFEQHLLRLGFVK